VWPPLNILYIIRYAVTFIICDRCYGSLDILFGVEERIEHINSYFNLGFQFSRGRLLFLGIYLEDIPHVFVIFVIKDVLKEGGTISNAAQLNLLVAEFDISHKIAESWDSRYDVGKMENELIRTLRGHIGKVESLLAMGGTDFVSLSLDGTLKLWDAATGKIIRKYEYIGHDGRMAKIDKTRIVVAAYNRVHQFNRCQVYNIDSETANATGVDAFGCVCAGLVRDGN
jgi:hypothetical protein